jgi:hypothetical protein
LNGAEPVAQPAATKTDGGAMYAASMDNMVPGYDSVFGCWTAPYVMQVRPITLLLSLTRCSKVFSSFS